MWDVWAIIATIVVMYKFTLSARCWRSLSYCVTGVLLVRCAVMVRTLEENIQALRDAAEVASRAGNPEIQRRLDSVKRVVTLLANRR
jgi:hypothetical protein